MLQSNCLTQVDGAVGVTKKAAAKHGVRAGLAWLQILCRVVEKLARNHGGFPSEPNTLQAHVPEAKSWYVLGRLWNQRAGLRRLEAVLQSALEQRLRGHRLHEAVQEVLAETMMRWETSEGRSVLWEILVPTRLPQVVGAEEYDVES
eukprot:4505798-Pleurochrysis_carterae.AAC.1